MACFNFSNDEKIKQWNGKVHFPLVKRDSIPPPNHRFRSPHFSRLHNPWRRRSYFPPPKQWPWPPRLSSSIVCCVRRNNAQPATLPIPTSPLITNKLAIWPFSSSLPFVWPKQLILFDHLNFPER